MEMNGVPVRAVTVTTEVIGVMKNALPAQKTTAGPSTPCT